MWCFENGLGNDCAALLLEEQSMVISPRFGIDLNFDFAMFCLNSPAALACLLCTLVTITHHDTSSLLQSSTFVCDVNQGLHTSKVLKKLGSIAGLSLLRRSPSSHSSREWQVLKNGVPLLRCGGTTGILLWVNGKIWKNISQI